MDMYHQSEDLYYQQILHNQEMKISDHYILAPAVQIRNNRLLQSKINFLSFGIASLKKSIGS